MSSRRNSGITHEHSGDVQKLGGNEYEKLAGDTPTQTNTHTHAHTVDQKIFTNQKTFPNISACTYAYLDGILY